MCAFLGSRSSELRLEFRGISERCIGRLPDALLHWEQWSDLSASEVIAASASSPWREIHFGQNKIRLSRLHLSFHQHKRPSCLTTLKQTHLPHDPAWAPESSESSFSIYSFGNLTNVWILDVIEVSSRPSTALARTFAVERLEPSTTRPSLGRPIANPITPPSQTVVAWKSKRVWLVYTDIRTLTR